MQFFLFRTENKNSKRWSRLCGYHFALWIPHKKESKSCNFLFTFQPTITSSKGEALTCTSYKFTYLCWYECVLFLLAIFSFLRKRTWHWCIVFIIVFVHSHRKKTSFSEIFFDFAFFICAYQMNFQVSFFLLFSIHSINISDMQTTYVQPTTTKINSISLKKKYKNRTSLCTLLLIRSIAFFL